jgi:SAM-dependent methyltransferase
MSPLRSIVARLLFQADRMADRISRTSAYLAVGTRRLVDMQVDHERAWDRFYAQHGGQDTRLLNWEEECVGRFVMPGKDVLIVGCGGGRDLVALGDRDCRLTGIDPSGGGIRIAERLSRVRGVPAKLIHGFFEDTPIPDSFDVVIFSYYCYAAIPMASRRIAALKKAAALVNPGGHVIVSHAIGIERPRAILIRLARLAGALTRSDWRLEPGDLVANNRERVPSYSFTHVFEAGELEAEAAAADLRVVFDDQAEDNTRVTVFTGA